MLLLNNIDVVLKVKRLMIVTAANIILLSPLSYIDRIDITHIQQAPFKRASVANRTRTCGHVNAVCAAHIHFTSNFTERPFVSSLPNCRFNLSANLSALSADSPPNGPRQLQAVAVLVAVSFGQSGAALVLHGRCATKAMISPFEWNIFSLRQH